MSTARRSAAAEILRARTAVAIAFAANGLAFAAFISRTPAIRDALGLSTAQLGLLLLCLSGGAVAGLPLSGPSCTASARPGRCCSARVGVSGRVGAAGRRAADRGGAAGRGRAGGQRRGHGHLGRRDERRGRRGRAPARPLADAPAACRVQPRHRGRRRDRSRRRRRRVPAVRSGDRGRRGVAAGRGARHPALPAARVAEPSERAAAGLRGRWPPGASRAPCWSG